MLWAALACATEPAAETSSGPCAAYADLPDAYGYCIVRMAARTEADVSAACADAGEWDAACREAWVTPRLSRDDVATDTLLEACGSADCRFHVVDNRRDPDALVQIALCRTHVGPYVDDCIRHALGGWLESEPDAEAIATLQANLDSHARFAGRHAAAAIACLGRGVCGGNDEVKEHCELTLVEIAADLGFCERVLGETRDGYGAGGP